MRLWTLHPCYLDAQGLVALWREALLAQKVSQGATSGYRNHPQLARFRESPDPQAAIASFLAGVLAEAEQRGYAFDASKIAKTRLDGVIAATQGQLLYDWRHLKQKLQHRDPARHKSHRSVKVPAPHPLYCVVAGKIAQWERVK
jgi:hypothetical protein